MKLLRRLAKILRIRLSKSQKRKGTSATFWKEIWPIKRKRVKSTPNLRDLTLMPSNNWSSLKWLSWDQSKGMKASSRDHRLKDRKIVKAWAGWKYQGLLRMMSAKLRVFLRNRKNLSRKSKRRREIMKSGLKKKGWKMRSFTKRR